MKFKVCTLPFHGCKNCTAALKTGNLRMFGDCKGKTGRRKSGKFNSCSAQKVCHDAHPSQPSASQSLVDKMNEKLKGARFRFINEALYTKTGSEARKMFTNDPETFSIYHEGYEMQKKRWPVDPLDIIIQQIKHVPRQFIVADMGCGSARLASSVPHTVHSFDLVAVNEKVTACDMSQVKCAQGGLLAKRLYNDIVRVDEVTAVPLENASVDVCVFCLSLMGTNLNEYLLEANRILKPKGVLKIVEICSRLTSVRSFRRCVEKLGFELTHKASIADDDYFIQLDFQKIGKPKQKNPSGFSL